MKAAVLFELNKPLRVIDIEQMPELRPGQVQVRMIYSGVCHSQLMEARGGRGADPYLPHLLGHEGVGIVEKVGPAVEKVAPGDRVVLGWIRGHGSEAPGGLYQYQDQTINSGGVTTFSELTIVAENRLVKLPEGIPARLAVLLGCALPTGAGLVFNELNPEPRKRVAIFGLGGIGLSALLAMRLFEPEMLIAVDVEPEKLALARELGASHTINASQEDPVAAITELTGRGVDYSLEAGGSVTTVEQAFESVRDRGGLCIFASHPPEPDRIRLDPIKMHRGKMIRGSWGGGANPDKDIPRLVDLYKSKQLPLDKLISHTYPLGEINQALADLEQRKIVRALIEIAPELDVGSR